LARQGTSKKLITPDDEQWFVLFLCSRWGKYKSEIEAMPYSEFCQHRQFWQHYRWGMTDDLMAIKVAFDYNTASRKNSLVPHQVKQWAVQPDYAFKVLTKAIKPVTAIRNGFMAIVEAVKGVMK